MNPGLHGLGAGASWPPPPRSLVRNSTTATSGMAVLLAAAQCRISSAAMPSADINSLTLLTAVDGRGVLNWAGAYQGTHLYHLRTVLEIDGIVLIDRTTNNVASDSGHVLVGHNSAFQPVHFSSGLRLYVSSNLLGAGIYAGVNAEVYP